MSQSLKISPLQLAVELAIMDWQEVQEFTQAELRLLVLLNYKKDTLDASSASKDVELYYREGKYLLGVFIPSERQVLAIATPEFSYSDGKIRTSNQEPKLYGLEELRRSQSVQKLAPWFNEVFDKLAALLLDEKDDKAS
jgi:hypothetical protein